MDMDISALAPVAMGLLSPYLAKGAEEFAKATGKASAKKVGDLYQAIKKKFQGNAYAEQTLGRVEEQPDSKNRQAALEGLLVELLEKDPSFAKMVRRLVQKGQASGTGDVMTATGSYIAQANRGSMATVTVNQPKDDHA